MKRTILSAVLIFFSAISFAQHTRSSQTSTVSTSVSVSNSDHKYTLRADFDNGAEEPIRKLIRDRLGNPSPLSATGRSTWKLEEVYIITLQDNRISMELDKGKATGSLTQSFVKLGKDIQQAISQAGQ
ncbi:hypothetical protein [Siphonobacter sp. SORGH_AS_1065]|uniref:hypothetical protein n=1 Tax=Siphonobacter sp. SORGH_AS_1065 TaxID=3041795 RepID=UPI0027851101|nr:hypothetical protein [Siphonobacter sp. SORGH_AS_1065]MDQ1090074.1 hypothetical protein [Siphonobacter sp. SORGH_AS_1065]